MLNVRCWNDEVAYATDDIARIAKSDINGLVRQALANPRQRMRVCTHRAPDAALHEMLIVHTKETYVRPHKHAAKSESFHVIEGDMDVVVFDEHGAVTDVLRLGDYRSGRTFYYRMHEPMFHTLLIRSDVVIFHEITAGPFRPEDTIVAPWEPNPDDLAARARYVRALEKKISQL
ncbi:MAG: WbuC family cupin fold metalloprotein [Planctomycetia bacterium]|nr:WbuC family cupin fold metalloprotein [Planctomycetia bacterium]